MHPSPQKRRLMSGGDWEMNMERTGNPFLFTIALAAAAIIVIACDAGPMIGSHARQANAHHGGVIKLAALP